MIIPKSSELSGLNLRTFHEWLIDIGLIWDTKAMIERFLDSRKRLAVWPSKQADKLLAVEYLASKFDAQTSYSELQVNDIIKAWHTFTDWPLLRREMVDRGLMERDTSGENYRLKKH